jgi:hypothetical protein
METVEGDDAIPILGLRKATLRIEALWVLMLYRSFRKVLMPASSTLLR